MQGDFVLLPEAPPSRPPARFCAAGGAALAACALGLGLVGLASCGRPYLGGSAAPAPVLEEVAVAELDSWEPVREGWELANSVGLPFRVCGVFSFAVEMVCKVGTVGLTALLGPGESDSAGPPGPSDAALMKKLQKLAEQMRRINTLVESIERNVETLLVDFHFHMDDMKSIVAHFQELQTLLVAYALSQSQEDLRLIQDYAYHADLEFAHATYSFLEPWSVQKLLEEVLRQSEASMPNAKFSSGIEAASALNWISLARVSLLNLMMASRINVTSREVAFADAGVEQLFQEAQGQLEEYQQIARRLGIGRSVRWGLSNLKALAPRCKAANTVLDREGANSFEGYQKFADHRSVPADRVLRPAEGPHGVPSSWLREAVAVFLRADRT
ncbi:unnamed protein product [Effrenium voratum]|nr:unnamed protein product [Effrenium voratum]